MLRGRVLWTWQKSGQLPILLIILLCNGWHPKTSTTFTNIMIIGKQRSHGWNWHHVLYNGSGSLSVSLWRYGTYSCTVRISRLTLVWVSVVGVYSVSLHSFSIGVCGRNSASVPSPSGQIHCNPSRADAGGVLVTLHSFTDAWWQTCCRLLSILAVVTLLAADFPGVFHIIARGHQHQENMTPPYVLHQWFSHHHKKKLSIVSWNFWIQVQDFASYIAKIHVAGEQ